MATYSYDAAGRLAQLTNFNGTVTLYDHDDANRLTFLGNYTSGGMVLATYGFMLDGNGNRTQETRTEPLGPPSVTPRAVDYFYNGPGNRLTRAGGVSYTFDLEGQMDYKGVLNHEFDYDHRRVTSH